MRFSSARSVAAWLLAPTLAVSALLALERPVAACGGCFHEPDPERPTVVTDHRMVLAVGRGKSTLYDQIRYSGNPREFAWVLPIAGEVEVGLSSDSLFGGLDALSQTEIYGPPMNCPTRPSDCSDSSCGSATSATSFEGASAPKDAVTVTRQEVIGPYATVQIQSTDPEALTKWLTDNGYAISADVKPIVSQYVRESFNFLALKLKPGASVQAMRPVRVTSRGPSVVLPLRMVAAGVGASVGITLWTVAEGRYEPQNYPWFRVADEDVSWDWAKNGSNFRDVRTTKAAASGGRGWEIESSLELPTGTFPTPRPTGFGAAPLETDNGYLAEGTKTSTELQAQDLAVLYDGRTQGTSRLTRMRADLAKPLLSEDLVLVAPADQALLTNRRTITRELSEPMCTVWVGCEANGSAPRSTAIARSTDHCSTSGTLLPRGTWAGVMLGFVALAFVRRRAARRAILEK